MSKFKVGDKVRTCVQLADAHTLGRYGIDFDKYWQDEKTRTVLSIGGCGTITSYRLSDDCHELAWPEYALVSAEPTREFIVIRRDGADVIASHKRGDEIVNTAKAHCNPSDEFNFKTGAELAFDRLMDRVFASRVIKAEYKEEPQPAHRFKVGDRVSEAKAGYGIGEVVEIDTDNKTVPYRVKFDGSNFVWLNENRLSPAPAPEPPKFYTGKVFAEKSASVSPTKSASARNGHVFEIVDGVIAGDLEPYGMSNEEPYDSFDAFKDRWFSTVWHEVKTDV